MQHAELQCGQARSGHYTETLSFVRLLNSLLEASQGMLPQQGASYAHFTRFVRTQVLGQLARRQHRCDCAWVQGSGSTVLVLGQLVRRQHRCDCAWVQGSGVRFYSLGPRPARRAPTQVRLCLGLPVFTAAQLGPRGIINNCVSGVRKLDHPNSVQRVVRIMAPIPDQSLPKPTP